MRENVVNMCGQRKERDIELSDVAGVDGAAIREGDGDAIGDRMNVDEWYIDRGEMAGATGISNVGRGSRGGTYGCSRKNRWGGLKWF
jgi:hypothetical protein